MRYLRRLCSPGLCSPGRLAACLVAAAVLLNGSATAPVGAASPDTAPPLPVPTGTVVNVSTEPQLRAAVAALTSGTTIVIAPGTYMLTGPLYLNGAFSDVVIRGATNNRNDVVLVGKGMNAASDGGVPFGIWTGGGVTRVTIANLTIRDVYYHPIIFNGGTQQPRVYNVRLLDAGQQFVKANPDGAGGGVNGGIVEYSVIEYTTGAPSWYTNGVDVHTGDGWIIRHNLFRRIRTAQGLAGPAVLMWNNSRSTIVEANTFIDNHRDISLGLIERTPNDHTGGVVRNNFIARSPGAGGDVAIGVMDSPGTRVVHNTIWMGGAYPNAVEYRFSDTTGVVVASNLADARVLARDGGVATVAGNVLNAPAGYFVTPAQGDLHLTAAASAALDQVAVLADAPLDWDGQPRPSGALGDIGADESAPPGGEICGDLTDNDGDGLVDEGCPPTEVRRPGTPAALTSSVQGPTITLDWQAPISGGPVQSYVLDAGYSPGSTLVSMPLGPRTTVSLPGVPPGTYVLRIRATGSGGTSNTSNEVAATIGGCASPPRSPRALAAYANGSLVTLRWNDDDGCEGRQFRLLVGTRSGAADLGAVPLTQTSLFAAIPSGQYFVRVVTEIRGGASAPSNEVRLVGGGACQSPAVALTLGAEVQNRVLTLQWDAVDPAAAESVDAATPLTYVLEAGLAPGSSNLGTLPLGRTTSVSAAVPPGQYYVRVRAASACGLGPASNDIGVTVP